MITYSQNICISKTRSRSKWLKLVVYWNKVPILSWQRKGLGRAYNAEVPEFGICFPYTWETCIDLYLNLPLYLMMAFILSMSLTVLASLRNIFARGANWYVNWTPWVFTVRGEVTYIKWKMKLENMTDFVTWLLQYKSDMIQKITVFCQDFKNINKSTRLCWLCGKNIWSLGIIHAMV